MVFPRKSFEQRDIEQNIEFAVDKFRFQKSEKSVESCLTGASLQEKL